jgi:hypothetical protein
LAGGEPLASASVLRAEVPPHRVARTPSQVVWVKRVAAPAVVPPPRTVTVQGKVPVAAVKQLENEPLVTVPTTPDEVFCWIDKLRVELAHVFTVVAPSFAVTVPEVSKAPPNTGTVVVRDALVHRVAAPEAGSAIAATATRADNSSRARRRMGIFRFVRGQTDYI